MARMAQQNRIHAQFDQFLRYVALTALGFAIVELCGGLLLQLPAVALVGVSMVIFALTLVEARRRLSQGRVFAACTVASLSFLIASVVLVTAMPGLLPVAVYFVLAACSLPLLFQSRRLFLLVAAGGVVTSLIIALVSLAPPLLPQPAPWVETAFRVSNLPVCTALMALFYFFIWQNFAFSIQSAEAANRELRSLQVTLEQQITERTAALEHVLADAETRAEAQSRLLAENQRQQAVIRELSVPVLPIGQATLVMPLVGTLDSQRLETLLQRALQAIASGKARRLVLDITGVPVVDEQVAAGLIRIPQAVKLLGTEVMLVGVSPEVAQTIVSLGLNLQGLLIAGDLEHALVPLNGRSV